MSRRRKSRLFFIRVNGIGHAFCRQVGCPCKRCSTIRYDMAATPGRLEAFPGWPDSPWRAHTSASLLVPAEHGDSAYNVGQHVLIDFGSGVPESLAASRIPGIEKLTAVLLTHWHPDHVLGLNQLVESLKRVSPSVLPIPLYCHPATYSKLQAKYPYDTQNLRYVPVVDGQPFQIEGLESFEFTALNVAHGKYGGCVIYTVRHLPSEMNMVFAWDIDTPDSIAHDSNRTNLDAFSLPALSSPDLVLLDCNTWSVTSGRSPGSRTGHTSFLQGWEFVKACRAKSLGLVHLSGHEDGYATPGAGYGWTDDDWIEQARGHASQELIDGRHVRILDVYQGTVLPADDLG